MRKLTLTAMMSVCMVSLAVAQSGAGTTNPTSKEVKAENQVVIKKQNINPATVKSVRMHKLETLPKKEEAVIEEKKTNQK